MLTTEIWVKKQEGPRPEAAKAIQAAKEGGVGSREERAAFQCSEFLPRVVFPAGRGLVYRAPRPMESQGSKERV